MYHPYASECQCSEYRELRSEGIELDSEEVVRLERELDEELLESALREPDFPGMTDRDFHNMYK